MWKNFGLIHPENWSKNFYILKCKFRKGKETKFSKSKPIPLQYVHNNTHSNIYITVVQTYVLKAFFIGLQSPRYILYVLHSTYVVLWISSAWLVKYLKPKSNPRKWKLKMSFPHFWTDYIAHFPKPNLRYLIVLF